MASTPFVLRPSPALVARLERVLVAFLEQSHRRHPNVELARAGRAGFAAICPAEPTIRFKNMVYGLVAGEEAELERAFARYREARIPASVEVALADGGEVLAARANDLGARPVSTHVGLVGAVGGATPLAADPGVAVRQLGRDEATLFAATLLGGHGAPERDAPIVAGWIDEPGVSLYLAEIDGAPAGAAALFVRDGVGYLANASTLPAYRGRGAQTALIARRLGDAARAGCDLTACDATFASPSHANLERAGMKIAYARMVLQVPAAGVS